LAFEVTQLTHGEDAARQARDAAHALFEGERSEGGSASLGRAVPQGAQRVLAGELAGVPETAIPQVRLAAGVPVVDLLVETGLAASKSAARRLIQQGGASLNGSRLAHLEAVVTSADLHDGTLLLRAGKKHYHRVVVQ